MSSKRRDLRRWHRLSRGLVFSRAHSLFASQVPWMTGFSKSIQLMGNCKYWVAKQHPWTGITHDFTGLCPLRWFVAVHRAVGASWLVVAIRTFSQPKPGVIEELPALCTQNAGRRIVVVGAVNADHLRHRQLFTSKVSLLRRHVGPESGVQV